MGVYCFLLCACFCVFWTLYCFGCIIYIILCMFLFGFGPCTVLDVFCFVVCACFFLVCVCFGLYVVFGVYIIFVLCACFCLVFDCALFWMYFVLCFAHVFVCVLDCALCFGCILFHALNFSFVLCTGICIFGFSCRVLSFFCFLFFCQNGPISLRQMQC